METLKFILLNIILPLTIGILGSFIFPRVESYLKYRSLSARQRKIQELLVDYKITKPLRDNHTLLTALGISGLARGLQALGLLVVILSIDIIFSTYVFGFDEPPFSSTSVIIAFLLFSFTGYYLGFLRGGLNYVYETIYHAVLFDEYKEETINKLKKLGGNPEDLDQEETEGS